MKISIALCTYNGAAYLQEQLDSFLQQNLQPNELIICDDGSQDATISLIEAFIATAPFPVMLYKNEDNLNINKNFEKAIGLCSGDLIFLCDQDDVWLPHKIEQTMIWMTAHPQIEAVFTDAILSDENLKPLPESLWERVGFLQSKRDLWLEGHALRMLVERNLVTGATLSIRPSLFKKAIPFPETNPYLLHDGWLAIVAARDHSIGFLEDKPMYYRQHEHQNEGIKITNRQPKSLLKKIIENPSTRTQDIEKRKNKFSFLYNIFYEQAKLPESALLPLKTRMEHFTMRTILLQQPRFQRILGILRETIKGAYFSNNQQPIFAILGDLLQKKSTR